MFTPSKPSAFFEAIRVLYETDLTPKDDPVNITISEVKRRYDLWNKRLFGGKLPDIKIDVKPLRGSSGKTIVHYTSKIGGSARGANSSITINNIEMVVSNSFKLTSLELDEVITHEMIHVEFASSGNPVEGHGAAFERRRQELSRMAGFEIPMTHDTGKLALNDRLNAKDVLVVVAQYKDNRVGIMLLEPSSEAMAKEWTSMVDSQVASVKLYKIRTTLVVKYPVKRTIPHGHNNRMILHVPTAEEMEHIQKDGRLVQ